MCTTAAPLLIDSHHKYCKLLNQKLLTGLPEQQTNSYSLYYESLYYKSKMCATDYKTWKYTWLILCT